ncbi:hypothetical protein SLS59_003235 [Nothophoma quercina]|uniref:Uncharacterized protein n=1 Tax=Nothophoma quercina TaxID=749835 RepID=A0ABR3RNU1_9PLEO
MRQRGVFIREFNNPTWNIGKFEGVVRVATDHVKAIVGDANSAEISYIRHTADNFAATLWGDTLYGRSDAPTDGHVMKVADEILRRAGSPWPSALYSFMLTFGLVEPGKPTLSESTVRADIEDLYGKNVQHLEIGHHSIGSNITWTLIELQKRPDVLAKLLNEIRSVGQISFTAVTSKKPYLDAVIMEINRLYRSVSATLRVIERETRLISCKKPVVLKPGMLIYFSYLHMHTSPKYWGDCGCF